MIGAAVLVYSALAIFLGWRAHRQHDEGAEVWTGGRRLGAGSVGLSISAGFMSVSWSCVYAVQLFYAYGLGAIWLITVPWLLSLAGIYLLAQRYRSLAELSQPEMVGARFGELPRRTVAVALAFVFLVWGGAEIYVAATLLAPGLGLPLQVVIAGICLVVGSYATLGGFRAVVATDKLQFGIVAAYVLAMVGLAVHGLREAGADLWPAADVPALRAPGGWSDLLAPGWMMMILTLVAYLPGWLFETDLWVRVQASRDARAARRGVLLAAFNGFLFVGILPLFLGVSALVLFPVEAGAAPAAIGTEGDAIFAALVTRYAPAWVAGLAAVGLVAAAMSTIDTCAHVVGLSIAYDLLALHRRPNSTGASRLTTAIVVAALGVFALNTESLWDLFYLSGGVLTTAVALPVAAVLWPRASPRGVAGSALGGLIGTIVAYVLESRGWLAAFEPEAVTASGLSYILWGLIAALVGYGVGYTWESTSQS